MKSLLIFFITCSFSLCAVAAGEDFPEWFYDVSPPGKIGSIGYSANISVDPKITPSNIASMRAINGLSYIIGNEYTNRVREIVKFIVEDQNSLVFGRGELKRGGNFVFENSRLEYLYLSTGISGDTADVANKDNSVPKTCDFDNCEPGWLCSQNQDGLRGFLGISFRADNLGRQLDLTRINAIELLEYSLGVNVEGKESYYTRQSPVMHIRYRSKSQDVEKKGELKTATFYTKAQCFKGQTLISWQVSEDLPDFPAAKNLDWLENPDLDGIDGAVGVKSKDYTGFLSRQLRNAYEEGIAQLAKGDEVKIKSEQKVYQSDRGDDYSSQVDVEYKAQIIPRILGIHLDEDDTLSIWVGRVQ